MGRGLLVGARHLLPWPGDLKGGSGGWGRGAGGAVPSPTLLGSLEVAAARPLSMPVSSLPTPHVSWRLSKKKKCHKKTKLSAGSWPSLASTRTVSP